MTQKQQTQTQLPAGWNLIEWCKSAGFARATYYTIPDAFKPLTVKIGDRLIIIEPPDAYLRRMATRGGVPIPQRKPQEARP